MVYSTCSVIRTSAGIVTTPSTVVREKISEE